MCQLIFYALTEMKEIVETCQLDKENIEKNLNLLGGKQLSERLMIALSSSIGRQQAHEVMREIAIFGEGEFRARLHSHPVVSKALTAQQIDALLDPHTYIGLAPQIVDRIVAKVHHFLGFHLDFVPLT